MKKYIHSILILVTACLLTGLAVQPALCAKGNNDPRKPNNAPIHVEADHMTSAEKSNSVLFKGNVDARQDDVRIRTDEMTVYYTPSGQDAKAPGAKAPATKAQASKVAPGASGSGDSKQQIEKMVCVGNVEISRGEWLGTSKKMNYLAKERQVHLIGNAKAWQGQNMVSGDKIIYYLDEQRSEVVADPVAGTPAAGTTKPGQTKPGRVNMTIIQK